MKSYKAYAAVLAAVLLTACGDKHPAVHAVDKLEEAQANAIAKAPKAEEIKFGDEGQKVATSTTDAATADAQAAAHHGQADAAKTDAAPAATEAAPAATETKPAEQPAEQPATK